MRKIVLLCSAGMSTSLLVTKMREAASAQSYEAIIDAYPIAEAEKVAADADLVLIGPQVRFQLAALKSKLSCPVEAIDMAAYGTMNGAKVIESAKLILGD